MVTMSLAPELFISQFSEPKDCIFGWIRLEMLTLFFFFFFKPAIKHTLFLDNFWSECLYKIEAKKVLKLFATSSPVCRFFDS